MIGVAPPWPRAWALHWLGRRLKMKIYLSCGAIGVKASMSQALDYAAQYGFEAIEADAGWLTSALR